MQLSSCKTVNPGRAYLSGVLTSPRPEAAPPFLQSMYITARQGRFGYCRKNSKQVPVPRGCELQLPARVCNIHLPTAAKRRVAYGTVPVLTRVFETSRYDQPALGGSPYLAPK